MTRLWGWPEVCVRINWMAPVRALWSLLWWIIRQINTWGGILISIPPIPLIWFFVMAAKGRKMGQIYLTTTTSTYGPPHPR